MTIGAVWWSTAALEPVTRTRRAEQDLEGKPYREHLIPRSELRNGCTDGLFTENQADSPAHGFDGLGVPTHSPPRERHLAGLCRLV